MPDEVERRVLGENDDKIHALQRCKHERALGVAAHGPRRTFEAAHRLIAVDADDERVGALARGSEEIDVAGMQKVEHTVSERYTTLSSNSPALGLNPCRNLRRGVSRLQGLLTTAG